MSMVFLPVSAQQERLETLGIAVKADASRPFLYTNKEAAYFYGEAAGPHRTAWQGFNVRGFVVLDDWAWQTRKGGSNAESVQRATIYPDHAERCYTSGLCEKVTLLDRLNALVLVPQGRAQTFQPLVADSRDPAYFDIRAVGDVLLVARRNRAEGEDALWLAVHARGARAEVSPVVVDGAGVDGARLAPGHLRLRGKAPVVLAVAATPEKAAAQAREVGRTHVALQRARAGRMQALLNDTFVRTADGAFNQALAWARLHLDALVMNQRGPGIFAGLPWFNNYWGRDSFIALPGALFVNGQWDQARAVLLAFARHQNSDVASADYGRIPNFVALDNVTYNTADGTPWFVRQAAAYLRHRDDPAFAAEVWPVVEQATEAALARTDAQGFLRHGDQETWMDASAGPGREWSPRGDRAVEIQGLFYEQLRAAADIARTQQAVAVAERYEQQAETLQRAFLQAFRNPDTGGFYDHLNADGTPDAQVRPNVLFALRAFGFDDAIAQPVTQQVARTLAYPWGVASLSQEDDAFHPYHEAPQFYPKDAAYHNGTIWTWLSGPLISLMAEQGAADLAYAQTQFLTTMALGRGAVGAMAENSDAFPQDGAALPRLTGTVSQAWTLAEYVRNAFEDYAGVRYAAPDRVILEPHLPAAWGETTVRFRMGNGYVTARMVQAKEENDEAALTVTLLGEGDLPGDARVEVRGVGAAKRVPVVAGETITVRLVRERAGQFMITNAFVNGEGLGIDAQISRPNPERWQPFSWQTPHLRPDLPALRGPTWPLLAHAAVKVAPPAGARLRLDLDLPTGDDRGPSGTYTYPTGSAFAGGIFDATGLTIRETDDAWFFDLQFRALTQPGWNPELGFQLTMAALAFGPAGAPATVGRESSYLLPDGYRFIVYVGAGVRVEDHFGNVLAEYRPAPQDVRDPLGTPDTRRIAFRLSKTVLPPLPDGTAVTLLVGGQDDHGGAGIGDFRRVEGEATEWTGGGRPYAGAPNVYDVATGTLTNGR